MTVVHLTYRPLTAAPDHVVWEMVCGMKLELPKQRFPRGHEVDVDDGDQRRLGCPTCFEASEAKASPEQIEAEQRRQQDEGAVTFDETLGAVESTVEMSDPEDDQLISEENEEYPGP